MSYVFLIMVKGGSVRKIQTNPLGLIILKIILKIQF